MMTKFVRAAVLVNLRVERYPAFPPVILKAQLGWDCRMDYTDTSDGETHGTKAINARQCLVLTRCSMDLRKR